MSKTHWKKTDNPNYLGAYAFDDGEKKTVTIRDLNTSEEIFNPNTNEKEDKFVVKFKEKEKPLILNTTNKKAIAKATGSDFIEDWVGKRIRLHVVDVPAFGEMTPAVRVIPKPVKGKPTLTVDHPKYKSVVKNAKSGDLKMETVEQHFNVPAKIKKKIQRVIDSE